MAEIKVEKKSSPIWPWILGLLIIVALLLYFFVFANDDTDDDMNTDDMNTEQVVGDGDYDNEMKDNEMDDDEMNANANLDGVTAVNTYTNFISDPNMDMDHEYASDALAKLIAATRATADALNVDIDADLTEANAQADKIAKDPTSLKHSSMIKDAGKSITHALQTIQTEKFPQLQAQYKEVEDAISKIDPNMPTLDEKSNIKAFFSKAGNLLTDIKNDHGKQ